MTHEEIAELLGAWALDAVDPDEAEIVARHLEVCPRCAQEVDGYREAAAALAFVGATAPAALWERIEARLEEEPPPLDMARITRLSTARGEDVQVGDEDSSSGPVGVAAGVSGPVGVSETAGSGAGAVPIGAGWRRRSRAGRAGRAGRARDGRFGLRAAAVAAFAAAAVVIAVLGVQVRDLQGQVRDVARGTSVSPNGSAVRVNMQSADHLTLASAVLAPNGSGYVEVGNLPALPPGKTYQLWAISGGRRISIGVLGNTFDVSTFTASGKVDQLAITAEDAPGVESSVQDPVVVAAVPKNNA